MLYLPRGWWHAPRGVNEPSLHLTNALPRPTGLDVFDWLIQQLADSPTVGGDLPSFASEDGRRAHADALKATFDLI
jgi:ribosomal protein L16 Arg81 hydroxylase